MDDMLAINPTCQFCKLEDHRTPGGNVLTAWMKSNDNLKEVSNSNFCSSIIFSIVTLKISKTS